MDKCQRTLEKEDVHQILRIFQRNQKSASGSFGWSCRCENVVQCYIWIAHDHFEASPIASFTIQICEKRHEISTSYNKNLKMKFFLIRKIKISSPPLMKLHLGNFSQCFFQFFQKYIYKWLTFLLLTIIQLHNQT